MAAVDREGVWTALGLRLSEEELYVAVTPPSLDIEFVEIAEEALGMIRSVVLGMFSKVFVQSLSDMFCDLLRTGDCAGGQH